MSLNLRSSFLGESWGSKTNSGYLLELINYSKLSIFFANNISMHGKNELAGVLGASLMQKDERYLEHLFSPTTKQSPPTNILSRKCTTSLEVGKSSLLSHLWVKVLKAKYFSTFSFEKASFCREKLKTSRPFWDAVIITGFVTLDRVEAQSSKLKAQYHGEDCNIACSG